MGILISALITFGILWLLIAVFSPGIDNKTKKILLLTVILVVVSFISSFLGIFGLIVGAIINFVAIMKILDYDFLAAFLFSTGSSLLYSLVT